jgi:TetR/AcrR family tetracycline transcriptional repressor
VALDRETVVRSALQVLDEVGLEHLTLRKIAGELGVQAPALYWHFKNKQALLDEMATTLLVDSIAKWTPSEGPVDWVEFVETYGRELRAMLLRHRDGAKMFSGTYLTDSSVYSSMERSVRTLTEAGFSPVDAVRGLNVVYCYTIGFVIEEQAMHPKPGEQNPQYDADEREKRVDAEANPLVAETNRDMFTDFDGRYEHGLRVIIRGLTPPGRADP